MRNLPTMWNDTLLNLTITEKLTIATPVITTLSKRHVSIGSQIVLTFVYLCGIIGNVSALITLFYKDKRRNRKHLLMLRCLATNDLVALLGMLIQMYVTIYVDSVTKSQAFCSLRIVWRLFGLFSGCVAIVMAAERWLALTRPFVYQKHVTFPRIVQCMLGLWIAALTLTSLPLFGFGLYYKNGNCVRYREATEPIDISYAYVWFFFGTLLCLSIVWCNLAVSRVLRKLGQKYGVLRRVSKSSSHNKPFLSSTKSSTSSEIGTTVEERAFAKLMAVLSISFVICWMPQMISIPLAQYSFRLGEDAKLIKKIIRLFHIIADILLCIHFTLDPYIYVLLRMPRGKIPLNKYLKRICCPVRSSNSFFTETTDHRGSSGDLPTPITEVPPLINGQSHEVYTETMTL